MRVRVRQEAAIEPHLRLLGQDVDLVAALSMVMLIVSCSSGRVARDAASSWRADSPPNRRMSSATGGHSRSSGDCVSTRWAARQPMRGRIVPGLRACPGSARAINVNRQARFSATETPNTSPALKKPRYPPRPRRAEGPGRCHRSGSLPATGPDRAADLLVAGAQQQRRRDPAGPAVASTAGRHQLHHAHALHVERPAPVDVAIGDLARVRGRSSSRRRPPGPRPCGCSVPAVSSVAPTPAPRGAPAD